MNVSYLRILSSRDCDVAQCSLVAGTSVSVETSASIIKVGLSGTLEPFSHITLCLISELSNFHLISSFVLLILSISVVSLCSFFLLPLWISFLCKMDRSGWCSGYILGLYLRDATFESLLARRIPWGSSWFSSVPVAKAVIVSRWDHFRLLPKPIQFNIHQSSWYSTICCQDNDVIKCTTNYTALCNAVSLNK
jgi:hypothetical protein